MSKGKQKIRGKDEVRNWSAHLDPLPGETILEKEDHLTAQPKFEIVSYDPNNPHTAEAVHQVHGNSGAEAMARFFISFNGGKGVLVLGFTQVGSDRWKEWEGRREQGLPALLSSCWPITTKINRLLSSNGQIPAIFPL